MRMTYAVHILAGCLALVFGYVALFAAKGAAVHRRSGMLFVLAMLTVGIVGMLIAIVRDVAPAVNIPAGTLAVYMVITALRTVRPVAADSRWLDLGLLAMVLAVGVASMTFAFEAIANGGMRNGMPSFPFFLFGIVGLMAAAGDVRVVRSGALQGAARLARHLWRMCFALFLAALSFFIGQAHVFPKPIRIVPLLALPVLAVLATMFYWLWRIRIRRSFRGIVRVSAAEAA